MQKITPHLWFDKQAHEAASSTFLCFLFAFNEAISFIVSCDTRKAIDYYWAYLSADPKAEQCGWLKDKYGLSWQITPAVMQEPLGGDDKKRVERVTQAFLKMKTFDIAAQASGRWLRQPFLLHTSGRPTRVTLPSPPKSPGSSNKPRSMLEGMSKLLYARSPDLLK